MFRDWLKTLGIDGLNQWDVLVFLHRHRTSLLSAEQIARLLCYGTGPVVEALDRLESLGMVERSRLSQGARLYQVVPLEPPRRSAFEELISLENTRAGRLLIAEHLKNPDRGGAMVLPLRSAKSHGRASRARAANRVRIQNGDGKWPKAI